MTIPHLPTGDGRTELSEEDRLGLIPTYIATRGELFEAEQRSIAGALLRRRPALDQLLDDGYLRGLHRAMFGQVWEWAGDYRRRETNNGVEPNQIAVGVRTLVDNARAWVEHDTFGPDELAVRFHHRLVVIHPFPNGNGRHGRIAADYLVACLDHEPFSWGASLAITTDRLRSAYRRALQLADDSQVGELLEFARA